MIRRYNASVGGVNDDHNGYHETITRASLAGAAARLTQYPPDSPLYGIHAEIMASLLGRSDWLLAYWTEERLMSVAARRAWADPDLQPLPFALAG